MKNDLQRLNNINASSVTISGNYFSELIKWTENSKSSTTKKNKVWTPFWYDNCLGSSVCHPMRSIPPPTLFNGRTRKGKARQKKKLPSLRSPPALKETNRSLEATCMEGNNNHAWKETIIIYSFFKQRSSFRSPSCSLIMAVELGLRELTLNWVASQGRSTSMSVLAEFYTCQNLMMLIRLTIL